MNFKQRCAIIEKYKNKWLEYNKFLNDNSGIYILKREENGFKYAYIGQSKHLLTRLAEHLIGFQHIDLSLRKHGLYSEKNQTGWEVETLECRENELDEIERFYIKRYADMGYQLRNKTSGGQNKNKTQINEYRPTKTYHDGLRQGYKKAMNEVRNYFTKYLNAECKKNNKICERMLSKFNEFIENPSKVPCDGE